MKTTCITLLAALSAPLAAWAVDDAAVQRCRAIVDAAPRLTCYDTLPLPSVRGATTAPVAAAAATAAATPPAQRDFGLPAPTPTTESIDSTIVGRFEGWNPDQQITLSNGQVWRVVDGSRAFVNLNGPKVRVERGVLGAFYMVIEGINQSPRVRRVR
jgi:hypothetical protein